MLAADLKQRLGIRARAFVSDPDAVTDAHLHLTIAVDETLQLAGAHNPDAVLMDIAFYRYLLLVQTNGVDEEQFKAYLIALKQITDPLSQSNMLAHAKSKARPNPYQ
ncbi:MAG: hypothetical protein JKY87_00275 [Mariprofundus sp.]|nr:hypothetical protein [Mariprofundus sp.]